MASDVVVAHEPAEYLSAAGRPARRKHGLVLKDLALQRRVNATHRLGHAEPRAKLAYALESVNGPAVRIIPNSAQFGQGQSIRSRRFRRTRRRRHKLCGSMGRVGACADNAAMENRFSVLQKNVLNQHSWGTREDLDLAIVYWIEARCHRRRRQRRLGKLTPIEFVTIMKDPALSLIHI